MVDLLDETIQSHKEQRYLELWQRYRNLLFAFIAVSILGTAFGVWYNSYTTNKNETLGSKLFNAARAADEGNKQLAREQYQELIDGGTVFGALASLRLANLEYSDGNTEAGNEILDAVKEMDAKSDDINQIAELMVIFNTINKDNSSEFTSRLIELSAPNQPWSYTAKELLAYSYHFQNEQQKARELLDSLVQSSTTPPALRSRSIEMLEIIGPSTEVVSNQEPQEDGQEDNTETKEK